MSAKNEKIHIKDILSSPFFEKAFKRARKIAANPTKALSLTTAAVARLAEEDGKPTFKGLRDNLLLLIRMIRAAIKGDYRRMSYSTIVKLIFAVVYFMFLVDFIPDFIPVLGYLDDAVVIGWVVDSVKKDIEAFKAWESPEHWAGQ